MIGAARAIGRVGQTGEDVLFLKLFPAPPLPPAYDMSQGTGASDACFSSSNSLAHRTGSMMKKTLAPTKQTLLSTTFPNQMSNSVTWTGGLSSQDSRTDLLSLASGSGVASHTRGSSFQSHVSGNNLEGKVTETHHFFWKFGSCFSQLARNNQSAYMPKTSDSKAYHFNVNQLQTVLGLAKSALDKELLKSLDELAAEVFIVS